MCWRDHRWDHKVLHDCVDEDDSEENDESDNENDDEDDTKRALSRIWWCWFWHWFWWDWFWCWFWWCWFERRDFVLRIVLSVVLKREKFFSFYIAEWEMSSEKWWTEHDNESDKRLLDRVKWEIVDFRRSRLFHLLLTCATMFVSSFMRFFTYCAFCFDDEHLTNAFLMLWFFASIAFWDRKTLTFDVIISSIIVALLDFVVTKKSLASVKFFVSDEMSLNDCVDRLDENEF